MGLEAATRSWRAGVVMVRTDGEWMAPRPAVFFFDTPRGWVWVEPSYVDPIGAASFALHERDGTPQPIGERPQYFAHDSMAGERIEVTEFDPGEDAPDVNDAIEWWESYLQASGRTKDQERQRVRAELELAGTFSPPA